MAEFGIEVSLSPDDYPEGQWAAHGVLAILEQVSTGTAAVDIHDQPAQVKEWAMVGPTRQAEVHTLLQQAIKIIEEDMAYA